MPWRSGPGYVRNPPSAAGGPLDYSTGSSLFDSQPELLLNNPEFESMLNTQYIWFNISLEFYDQLALKYQIILTVIEDELVK